MLFRSGQCSPGGLQLSPCCHYLVINCRAASSHRLTDKRQKCWSPKQRQTPRAGCWAERERVDCHTELWGPRHRHTAGVEPQTAWKRRASPQDSTHTRGNTPGVCAVVLEKQGPGRYRARTGEHSGAEEERKRGGEERGREESRAQRNRGGEESTAEQRRAEWKRAQRNRAGEQSGAEEERRAQRSRGEQSRAEQRRRERRGGRLTTAMSSLSNHCSLSSALGHMSGLRAVFIRLTQRRDNSSPGEPATLVLSFT